MIIFTKKKLIFIKTFKTAGTAIETELSAQLGSDDIQLPFGFGDERVEGKNYRRLRLGIRNLIASLRHPYVAFRIIAGHFLTGTPIINEHTDAECLTLFFPEYQNFTLVSISRPNEEVNQSNYRMHQRRYNYDGSFDKFIQQKGRICNNYFFKGRAGSFTCGRYEIFEYSRLAEAKNFFRQQGLELSLQDRVN
ncbi:hypothetical protein [Sulfitobacter sp. W074]|uniref:hypothetical protein n=1 Tax=Sulfitobacter sp. W074 TaxID=2867026 RepID=UPI0021A5B36C|nr:hypothetical protein [Sulfitobacter sp. W074]UWR39647.1 hypothetical protein K3762_19355 [Sulfitobacter sp. W074]